ncbi:MAG: ABC transporter substrate-binding protein [Ignavibacteriae bacterium]|nr:ABC transporter substrate-binding protein [Ignavibacteriota bacterium]MCB9244189.1 ABC transporter substrate-binding protein [Ignavibacteriales bacterium]
MGKLKTFLVLLASLTLISTSFQSCSTTKKKEFNTQPVSIKTKDVPPGALPDVSAELGGDGFTGEGWITNDSFHTIGNPEAVKGGSITLSIPDFPSTLRVVGKDANSYWNYLIYYQLCYESLLNNDPVTLDFEPMLATHWWISEDKKQFKFRINPDARWADGERVTSADVIATWKLQVDPGILSPYSNILFGSYEEPVAESPYIVSVKTKELNWRQFLYFAGMPLLPAHVIGNLSGKEYLEKHQFDFIPGTGAYVVDVNDVKKGQSLTVRRRSDYWGADQKWNTGKFNFDYLRFEVISDSRLEFERFKKGDIDFVTLTSVTSIDKWFELDKNEDFKRGLILKRDVYNKYPNGPRGICFNMRKPPFDDIRVRKAFAYLFDRAKIVEKLYYGLPALEDSYWPNSVYANPNNPQIRFNFDEAVKLLAEAGWTEKNADGYLVKDGKIFEVELPYGSPELERFLTIYQEDCKKAGIKINLRQVDGSTNFQIGNQRNFEMIVAAWGGLVFPNPESSFGPGTADLPNSTNWAGVKDARIDELCTEYNVTFDQRRRVEIIQEIDAILANMQPYALSWYYPSSRLAFWNKFGFPEGVLSKIDDPTDAIPTYWFNDPVREAAFDDAKANNTLTLPQGDIIVKYWSQEGAGLKK